MTNQLKTVALMGLLTALVVWIGSALGGRSGMVIAFLFALVMNGGSYWFSDKMAIKMTRSRPLPEEEAPGLYAMIRRLSRNAGLPMPKVYLTPSPQPNAFATGRDPQHSAVAVTEGIMKLLRPEEVEGVLAHELAHIKNRDVLISTVAAVMAGVVAMLANWAQWALIFGFGGGDDEEGGSFLAMLPMIILGPLAAMLVQAAISRSREFQADAQGAAICGNPIGLADALERLEKSAKQLPLETNPAASHMFIVQPLRGQRLASLFSTHPPTSERVSRLREMGEKVA